MGRRSITLLLTLLDDAWYLPEWTECARRLEPDEVVVIDGGSTDDGAEYLERQGLPGFKLIRRPMEEVDWHYSNQLNFGIGHSRGDWILLLDADEVLFPPSRKLLERAVRARRRGVVSLWLPRFDLWPDEKTRIHRGTSLDPQPRFWYRESRIQWYRKVHNQQVYRGDVLGHEHWRSQLLKRPVLLHRKHVAPRLHRLARHRRWLKHWAEASAEIGQPILKRMPEEFGPTVPLPAGLVGWREELMGQREARRGGR